MSTFFITMMIAFIVVSLAIASLAISWLIKGKSSLKSGACGRDPTKKKNQDEECGSSASCGLCEKKDTNDTIQQK